MNPLFGIVGVGLLIFAFVTWILLRVSLFVSERWDILTMRPDLITITIRLQRLLLLLICAIGLLVAVPGALFGIGMGISFGGSYREFFPHLAALLGFSLHMLAALILNFPGFPLRLHQQLFAPLQFVLLPSLLLLAEPSTFLVFSGVVSVVFGLWFLNIRDRRAYEQ